jgi:uncharacterized protein YciI
MFIISLHYIVPLEQLDAYMADHVKFLGTYYKQNIFLTSGRKVPRTGGIIIARADSKEELEAIMAEDPFCKHGLAEVTITEFLNSQMHPAFRKMMKENFSL